MYYPSNEQRLVSASVLADRLGIKAADLRRAARDGRIPHSKVGRDSFLFDEQVVRRVLLAKAAKEARHDKLN